MTNNYIKVTTRTTRPFSECEHLAPEAKARCFSTTSAKEYNNLTWFLPTNDRDPVQFDAGITEGAHGRQSSSVREGMVTVRSPHPFGWVGPSRVLRHCVELVGSMRVVTVGGVPRCPGVVCSQ